MERTRTADRMELSKLYEAYAPMVYRRSMMLLRDQSEAEDMMQNVFLRVFERWNSLDVS